MTEERTCAKCARVTEHVAGKCQRCSEIAAGVAAEMAKAAAVSTSRTGWSQRRITISVGTVVAIVAGIVGAGFVHCVHGPGLGPGGIGITIVEKEDWGYYDQVVDVEDFVGKPVISLLDRARTVRALVHAGIISFPGLQKPSPDYLVNLAREASAAMCRCRDSACAYEVLGNPRYATVDSDLRAARLDKQQAAGATVAMNRARECFEVWSKAR